METIFILLLALVLDLVLGEPPDAVHPVAWMGRVASFLGKISKIRSPVFQFVYGAVVALFTIALFTLPVYFLLLYLENFNPVVYIVVAAVLFKFTFSLRKLRKDAIRVKELLVNDKLDEARFELRSLVSRDAKDLSKPLIISATVESVAENTSDSFVAPLFYFLLLGIPGAIAYRVINTLDAMFGYHGEYEFSGKFISRLDDVVNFIPARLTALLFIISAFLSRQDGRQSWQVALHEHAKTESPNAGWPMAAAAGALKVRLEKTGDYSLGRTNAPLAPQTIDNSLKLLNMTVMIWIVICLTAGGMQFAF